MPDEQEVLPQDAVEEVAQEEVVQAEETQPVGEVEAQPAETVESERPVYNMPVAKAQEEKRKAVEKAKAEAKAEAEAEMKRLREEYEQKLRANTPEAQDYKSKLQQIALEHNLDQEGAEKLLDLFKSTIQVPDMSKYDALIKNAELENIKQNVRKDIESRVVPLIKQDNPNVSASDLAEITAKVQELAFTEGFHTYRLEDIYRLKREEIVPKSGFTVETPKGRTPSMTTFKNLSDDEEHKLAENDPEAFKAYLKYQMANTSKYLEAE